MPKYSRHQLLTPPEAPPRESTRRLVLRAHAVFVLFTIFALPFWVHLLGVFGTGVLCVLMTLATLGWFVPLIVAQRETNPFPWRRLPWAAVGYMLWAIISITWSEWPASSALALAGMLIIALHAFFLVYVLSWRELMRVIASALKWIVGLSFAFELWVSVVLRHPVLPFFFELPSTPVDPQWYWSRNNLFDWDARIQGILGNANLLAILCLVAVLVFAVRIAAGAPRVAWLWAWLVLAAFLLVHAGSATVFMCAFAAVCVLITVLVMRRASTPSQRAVTYVVFAGIGAAVAISGFVFRDVVFGWLGRSGDLTGRAEIWNTIIARIVERPVVGWGYSSPWIPFDPNVAAGLVDHGLVVMQAHNMWIDVVYQVGWIGGALMIIVLAALMWRAWFFAVDRPRWDLTRSRPYAALSVFPILMFGVFLVMGVSESTPIFLWGWMMVLILSFKIKTAPIVGVGTAEQAAALEIGERPERRR